MMILKKTCIYCKTLLSAYQADVGHVCGNVACQWRMKAEPEKPRCKACGRVLELSESTSSTCRSADCTRIAMFARSSAEIQAKAARDRVIAEDQLARATIYRADCGSEIGLHDIDSFAVTIVPRNTDVVSDLVATRRDMLRDTLVRLATEAFNSLEELQQSDVENPETAQSAYAQLGVDQVLIAACTDCRGNCCVHGNQHAYLTVQTMVRYFKHHPGEGVDDVVNTYLSHVVERTMSRGCIYQGAEGCTLPRELRSKTCNNFLCGALRSFLQRRSGGAPDKAFIVSTDDGTFDHGIFATAEFVQIARRPEQNAVVV